ncbi:MAG: hypothetical protein ABW352_12375 [Polyangiales bacterium]
MTLRRLCLVLPLLFGCDAELAPGAVVGSTRVQPIMLRAEGVPDHPLGWQDTQLDVECKVATAADGERRCLPTGVSSLGMFVDEDCTRELLYSKAYCDEPTSRYGLITPPPDECDGRVEVVELEPIAEVTAHFLRSRDADGRATCVRLEPENTRLLNTQAANVAKFRRKRAVDPATFARVVSEERTAGVPVRVYDVLEDGARIVREQQDERGASCWVQAFEQGAYCIGELGYAKFQAYADARCLTPVYHLPPLCGAEEQAPRHVLETSQRCGTELPSARLYGVQEQSESHERRSLGGACEPNPDGERVYVRGLELPLSSLPAVPLTREGSARLQAVAHVDERGQRTVLHYWDRALSMVCTPMRAADGSYRCLPRQYANEVFADPGCSEPRARVGCEAPMAGQLASLPGLCGMRAVRLGAPVASGTSYVRGGLGGLGGLGDSCRVDTTDLFGTSGSVSMSAEELPATAFALFEQVVP